MMIEDIVVVVDVGVKVGVLNIYEYYLIENVFEM